MEQVYISKGTWFKRNDFRGTMLAQSGELIQELILANTAGLSINTVNKSILIL
jgi:hypothetical protein